MLSVIIPTHNRAKSAVRLATTLDSQQCADEFEIVFVLDGCTDGTREALESLKLDRPIYMVETPGLGAAAARNRGAEAAHGELLLFLDDDILPQQGALDAHIRLHRHQSRTAVVGPCPYAPEMPVNPLDFLIRDWWRLKIEELSDPDHESTYQDCCTGNLSLYKRDFEAIGRFDEAFEKDGREDYEFGVRLLQSGFQLKFASDAVGYHYPCNRPKSLLKKWYVFGRADVYFAQKHPELIDTLLLARRWSRTRCFRSRLAIRAVFRLANPLRVVNTLGYFFDRNLERLWDLRYQDKWGHARDLAYLLGALSAAGGIRQLDALVKCQLEPDELPLQSTAITDVDLLSSCGIIPGAEKNDRTYVVGRVGKSVAGWVDIPCQDTTTRGRLAKRLSDYFGWSAWDSVNAIHKADIPLEIVDVPAIPLYGCDVLNSEASGVGVSAIILSDGASARRARLRSRIDCHDIVVVNTNCKNIKKELARALAKCQCEVIVILKGYDLPDAGWAQAATHHFSDKLVSCVITPVIPRDISSYGDELYNHLVRFDRVRSWESTRLTDWLSSAGILKGFAVPCHRLLMRRSALKAAIDSSRTQSSAPDDLVTDILYSTLHLWKTVVYEPRAIIWRNGNMAHGDVEKMVIEHQRRIYRVATKWVSLTGTGRIRAVRLLLTLCKHYKTNRDENVNSLMGSVSGANRRIMSAAALCGIAQGIMQRTGNKMDER